MAITPLAQRLSSLPLVLAGPMVRRVTSNSVTVWVALRFPRKVRLQITLDGAVQGSDGELETLLVGQHIHIAAVTWHGTLTAGTSYTYNLFFDSHSNGDAEDDLPKETGLPTDKGLLKEKILADDPVTAHGLLTYKDLGGPDLPSFVVPPIALNDVRILHGSCRWIASDFPGGPDTLSAADGMVAESFTNSSFTRPQLMFFTGDQIYADGAEELFPVVHDAGPTLLGWDEVMPGLNGLSELPDGGLLGRLLVSLNTVGVTNFRRFHLYGIGEFLAYYLLHYSQVLWPAPAEFGEQKDFRGTLPAVRRALANIATYMIFDDHEFTDSWYCTAEWCEKLLEKPMGRHVLLNALSSYALCQGWGNDPDHFASGLGANLLAALEARFLNGDNQDDRDRIAALLGIPNAAKFKAHPDLSQFHDPKTTVRWHYTVPLEALDILVLDTFTWRSYPSKFGLCEHISSSSGLEAQIDKAELRGKECLLVVVSNVAVMREFTNKPDLGARLYLEHWVGTPLLLLGAAGAGALLALGLGALGVVIALGGLTFASLLDLIALLVRNSLRSWYYANELGSNFEPHSKSFEQLIARLAKVAPQDADNPGRVVILSGDIHDSYTMRVDYWADKPYLLPRQSLKAVFAQLVSSPLRRRYPKARDHLADAVEVEGWWAGWDGQRPSSPTSFENSRLDSKEAPWIAGYEPRVVPSGNPPSPKPDWHYRLELVLPNPSQPTGGFPLPPDHPNPSLAELLNELTHYPKPDEMAKLQNAPVIQFNNLCDVQFHWTADQKTVIHQIWTRTDIGNVLEIFGITSADWTTTRTEVSMVQPTLLKMPGE